MASEKCEYCHSAHVVSHSEGSTCTTCCRLQPTPLFLPPRGFVVEDKDVEIEVLSELQALQDRHLINSEIVYSSQKLYQKLRKVNINFTTSTLLIIVIHQSMAEHIGAAFTITQLSSLLSPDISANILMKRYINLWQKFPKLFTFSPYFPC